MSQRTTITAVEDILQGDYDSIRDPTGAILQARIDTASVLVDRVTAYAVVLGSSLTTTEQELIERWLAAHFYVATDRTYASRNTQGASGSFDWKTAMNLEGSAYGQTALSIDYSGALTAISKRAFPRALWLGKPPSTQIDVENRS